jgi:hypothetical protein
MVASRTLLSRRLVVAVGRLLVEVVRSAVIQNPFAASLGLDLSLDLAKVLLHPSQVVLRQHHRVPAVGLGHGSLWTIGFAGQVSGRNRVMFPLHQLLDQRPDFSRSHCSSAHAQKGVGELPLLPMRAAQICGLSQDLCNQTHGAADERELRASAGRPEEAHGRNSD